MDASDRRFRSRTNASTPRDAAKTSSSCRCCWLGGGGQGRSRRWESVALARGGAIRTRRSSGERPKKMEEREGKEHGVAGRRRGARSRSRRTRKSSSTTAALSKWASRWGHRRPEPPRGIRLRSLLWGLSLRPSPRSHSLNQRVCASSPSSRGVHKSLGEWAAPLPPLHSGGSSRTTRACLLGRADYSTALPGIGLV